MSRPDSAGAVLAAVLLALTVAACGQNAPSPVRTASSTPLLPATSRPTPTATPTPTPAPTLVPSPPTPRALRPGEDDWGMVSFANGLRDSSGETHIAAIAVRSDGWVAVGDGPTGAAAWTSPDGIRWARVTPLHLGDREPLQVTLVDVAAYAGGFVAVGAVARVDGTSVRGAAWVSADGERWREVAVPGGDGVLPQQVVAVGSGLVAVGSHETPDGLLPSAAWTSADGATWRLLDVADAVAGERPSGAVGSGPPGAVHLTAGAARVIQADGTSSVGTWLPNPRAGPAAEIPEWGWQGWIATDVAWSRDHFVAVGTVAAENPAYDPDDPESDEAEVLLEPAAWTSTDGLTWRSLPLDMTAPAVESLDGDAAAVEAFGSVVAVPDGRLLATTGRGAEDPGLWISDDGSAWSRLTPAAPGVTGIRAFGDRLVAFGSAADDELPEPGWSAAIWTSPSPDGTAGRPVCGGPSGEPPVPAPAAGLILFRRLAADGTPEAWLAAADGTGARKLADADWAQWSADGLSVHLLTYDTSCVPSLSIVAVDGGEPQPIRAALRSGDWGFSWSPNGTQVAFVRFHAGMPSGWCPHWPSVGPRQSFDVIVMRADGSAARVLLRDVSVVTPLLWSPDSSRLAFTLSPSSNAKPASHVVVRVRNGAVARLDRRTVAELGSRAAVWSPDGTRLAFVTDGATGYNHPVVTVRADGSSQRALAGSALGPGSGLPTLAWSPDGTWIAALRHLDTFDWIRAGLVLVAADGSGERDLGVSDAIDHVPTWSPDGRWIAYISHDYVRDPFSGAWSFAQDAEGRHISQVMLVSTSGGGCRALAGTEGIDPHTVGITSREAPWLSWQPVAP